MPIRPASIRWPKRRYQRNPKNYPKSSAPSIASARRTDFIIDQLKEIPSKLLDQLSDEGFKYTSLFWTGAVVGVALIASTVVVDVRRRRQEEPEPALGNLQMLANKDEPVIYTDCIDDAEDLTGSGTMARVVAIV